MLKVLITGVSSGIGRELTRQFVARGDQVWGVARRGQLLLELKKDLPHPRRSHFSTLDVTRPTAWPRLISQMCVAKFAPQVVIFNAAILENDFADDSIDLATTRTVFETNYFSILTGFSALHKFIRPKTQIIFIGSVAAFKGSGVDGIGYAGSKAALHSAFESLAQKFGRQYNFKIVHFGPIQTGLVPFKSRIWFMRSREQAAAVITRAIDSTSCIFYYPLSLFILVHLLKFLPSKIYLSVLNLINFFQKRHRK